MENLTPKYHYHVWLDGDPGRAIVNVRELAEELPHGSGIDGDWTIVVRRNGDLGLFAEYHRMNDGGYYAGWARLRASLKKLKADVVHSLGTPGFVQILNRKGDIVLTTLGRGDVADWFHECLSEDLKGFVTQREGECVHQATGQRAEYSRELRGWVVSEGRMGS